MEMELAPDFMAPELIAPEEMSPELIVPDAGRDGTLLYLRSLRHGPRLRRR
jgi:hypothetical protein